MLSQGCIWMRDQLGLKLRVIGWRNGGLGTRRGAGAEILTAALFGQPAFEAARADGKGGEHLLARHSARARCQHPFPKVKRITTHASEYRTRS